MNAKWFRISFWCTFEDDTSISKNFDENDPAAFEKAILYLQEMSKRVVVKKE